MNLNNKQQNAYEKFMVLKEDEILAINAPAGTGKTFLSKQFYKQYDNSICRYLALNRIIVDSVKEDMPDNVICTTFHELAIEKVGMYFKENLEIVDKFDAVKTSREAIIKTTLNSFSISDKHDYWTDLSEFPIAIQRMEYYINNTLPMTYNMVLKVMHILMIQGKIKVQADVVIADECQDLSPVMIEILMLIKSKKTVIAGDMNQHIYAFMGAVNAFKRVPCKYTVHLTKSHRFSEDVQRKVDKFVRKFLK